MFIGGVILELKKNGVYVIKDEFYNKFSDEITKQDKGGRPHYYCIDDNETELLWVIPLSKPFPKYIELEKQQFKHIHDKLFIHTIRIFEVFGRKSAFLFNDMFPITPKYISHEYRHKNGEHIIVHSPKVIREIEEIALKMKKFRHDGKSLSFLPQPNVLEIKKKLIEEIYINKSIIENLSSDNFTDEENH